MSNILVPGCDSGGAGSYISYDDLNNLSTLTMTPIFKQEKEKAKELSSTNTAMASIPPLSSSPSAMSPPRAVFTLGAPESRRPSLSSSSNSAYKVKSRASLSHSHSHDRRRSSLSPARSRVISNHGRNDSNLTSSTSTTSTSSSSVFNATATTSPLCKRSDSACFSDITTLSSQSSGASSTVELSRATSCAHPECVMAPPCERMIELSGIKSWPSPSRLRQSSPTTSDTSDGTPPPPVKRARDLMILDNACGTSALVTSQLIDVLSKTGSSKESQGNERAVDSDDSCAVVDGDDDDDEEDNLMRDTQIIASDLSQKVISQATRRIAELDWADHVFTLKMNQEHMLGLRDGELTHVFTNFGIYLAKDVDATLKEMKRVLVPGGICAFTVWKRLPWLDILAKAIKTEYPARPMNFPLHDDALMSLTRWNPWHDAEWIEKRVKEAGFIDTDDETKEKREKKDDSLELQAKESQEKVRELEDWSQYEFESGEARATSRRNSADDKGSAKSPKAATSPTVSASAPTIPSYTTPAPLAASSSTPSNKVSIIIEEITSTHRYTKHEFMSNFGTSVLDHLLAASWGKEHLSKEENRKNLREALGRYLTKICPDQMDEIELELTALVVVVKKGDSVDTPSEM